MASIYICRRQRNSTICWPPKLAASWPHFATRPTEATGITPGHLQTAQPRTATWSPRVNKLGREAHAMDALAIDRKDSVLEATLPQPAHDAANLAPPSHRLYLLTEMLRQQHMLTGPHCDDGHRSAAEAFSNFHDGHDARLLLRQSRYRELMPASPPQPGQQYAFEVDLDRCTGCKACVTACHSLNGLDENETWRFVGMLHGGTREAPFQQTVTTACHHCVDPACMKGCPVNAYEKDPVTGIVRHLDDQCIGCQYCTLTCPYEVPQFSKRRGIVRKCDMCSDRLAEGEAPACVQACPNEAISIRIVETQQLLEQAQTEGLLPGTPSSGITVPATQYKTRKVMPKNLLPGDFYAVRAGHQHTPLVIMLVLTQLSAGAFWIDFGLH